MENKIFDFQFEPVCAKQTCPNYSAGSYQVGPMEYTKMVQLKNVKRCQPVKNACAVMKFRQLRHFI